MCGSHLLHDLLLTQVARGSGQWPRQAKEKDTIDSFAITVSVHYRGALYFRSESSYEGARPRRERTRQRFPPPSRTELPGRRSRLSLSARNCRFRAGCYIYISNPLLCRLGTLPVGRYAIPIAGTRCLGRAVCLQNHFFGCLPVVRPCPSRIEPKAVSSTPRVDTSLH